MLKTNKYGEKEVTQDFGIFEIEFVDWYISGEVEVSTNFKTFDGGRDIVSII